MCSQQSVPTWMLHDAALVSDLNNKKRRKKNIFTLLRRSVIETLTNFNSENECVPNAVVKI